MVGNGTFDTTLTTNGFPSLGDYGNAFMKLSTTSNQLAVADYFDMNSTVSESGADTDLGSGGALVLPDMLDGQGHIRQLAVGAGKDTNLYIVDRMNLGKFNPVNDSAIYQELDGVLPAGFGPCLPTSTARFITAPSGVISRRFRSCTPGSPTVHRKPPSALIIPAPPRPFPPTATPMASLVRGNATTAACTLRGDQPRPGVLLQPQVAGGRDNFGSGNKYITPTIASARVYVGTKTGVGVLGLLDTSTLTPLQTWRNSHFGNPSNVGTGANGASPTGDGVPNLIKYALGLNPSTPVTAAQLPSGGIQPSGGTNFLTLTVNRAAQPSDVTYIVEVSSNLPGGWVSGPPNTVTLTNTATQLIVRDTTPVQAATERFIRLRVTNP